MTGVWVEVQSFKPLGKKSGHNLEWKGQIVFGVTKSEEA